MNDLEKFVKGNASPSMRTPFTSTKYSKDVEEDAVLQDIYDSSEDDYLSDCQSSDKAPVIFSTHKKAYSKRRRKVLAGLDFETSQIFPTNLQMLDGWMFGEMTTTALLCTVYISEEEQFFFEGNNIYGDLMLWIKDYTEENEVELQLLVKNLDFDFAFLQGYLLGRNIMHEVISAGFKMIFVTIPEYNAVLKNIDQLFTGMSLKQIGEWCGNKKIDLSPLYSYKDILTEEDKLYGMNDSRICVIAVNMWHKYITEYIPFAKFSPEDIYTGANISYKLWKQSHDKSFFADNRLGAMSLENTNFALKSVIGGVVIAKEGRYKDLWFYDITNSYPSALVEFDYPTNYPILKDGVPPKGLLYIAKIKIIKMIPRGPDYLGDYVDDGYLTLCNVDIETMETHYDVEYEYVQTLYFLEHMPGEEIFGKFVRTFGHVMASLKEREATDSNAKNIRTALKTPYNGLSGKFCTKIYQNKREFRLERGMIKSSLGEIEYMENLHKYFTPITVFCMAYARRKLLAPLVELGYSNLAYTDTDSMALKVPMPEKFLGKFGKFGLQDKIADMIVMGKKTYAYQTEKGKIKTATKGIRIATESVNSIDEFLALGTVRTQVMRKIKGGRGMVSILKRVIITEDEDPVSSGVMSLLE